MKKVFLFIAAAALTLAACEKKPVIPVDPGKDDPTPEVPEEGYFETVLKVDITLKDGVNNTYDGTEGVMPGDKILAALDMTATEFYKAMGTYSGSAIDMQTSQENNTILFGVADGNNKDDFKWIPSSSNNFGHWFTKDGKVCGWGDDAFFFVESRAEWGLEEPDAETLSEMWSYTVGCFPGRTKAGETYKATQVFFYTDDDDVENYVYVEWNVKIEAAEAVTLNVVGTEEVSFDSPFNNADNSYPHTPIEVSDADLTAAIGVGVADADVYGVNTDGSFSLAPGKNFWFDQEGNISSWGAGAGICINDDDNDGVYAWCMFPDEELGGKSLKGAIAFVNPETNNAYVVKVTVNVEGIDYLAINVLVSYEEGVTPYTLTENNIAAIGEALGVETLDLAAIGGDIAIKGVNADGSIYEGNYTANNGYWYTLEGNVADWAAIEAAGYVGAYIEYAGEGKFNCGLWEEPGVTATVKLALVKGDKTAILTFNLEVDEAKSFETEEAGVLNKSTSQALSAGYGGGVLEITEAEVAALIEGTPENWYILDTEGNMNYTANGGFWYNANGEVCAYADGAFFIEPGEAFPSMNTGIHPGNVTAAATFTGSFRIANPDAGKHVTVNATITVTE